MVAMVSEIRTIKIEIQLPSDLLYSLSINKANPDHFIKKNFLLELYREGRISLGRMASLLGLSKMEMLGILKDLKIPLNYGISELDKDIETLKGGILNESNSSIIQVSR